MTPIEKNARRLIGVMVNHFPGGATCEDLRRQFEKETGLARQSFYNALHHSKGQGWIVGGGSPRDQNQLYNLSPNGSWKEEPVVSIGEGVGEVLDKDWLEYLVNSQNQQIGELQIENACLRDWSNGDDTNGAALSSLLRIVSDNTATARQRIKAAGAVLGYKVHDDSAVSFTKGYLRAACADTSIAVDHRIEAGELLRKHEAPKVQPSTVRSVYEEPEPAKPVIPLKELVRQRHERQVRMEREQIERELGLPPGGAADIADPCDFLLKLHTSYFQKS